MTLAPMGGGAPAAALVVAAAPMVHGFLISALVVLVALAVEYFMGILPF